jgi:hypothetical protein
MREAVLVGAIVLALVGAAPADDDDDHLETRALGDAIPERLRSMEQEWTDEVDVGVGIHTPSDEATYEHEGDVEAEEARAPGDVADEPHSPKTSRPADATRSAEATAPAKGLPDRTRTSRRARSSGPSRSFPPKRHRRRGARDAVVPDD